MRISPYSKHTDDEVDSKADYCPSCQKPLLDTKRRCPFCGQAPQQAATAKEPTTQAPFFESEETSPPLETLFPPENAAQPPLTATDAPSAPAEFPKNIWDAMLVQVILVMGIICLLEGVFSLLLMHIFQAVMAFGMGLLLLGYPRATGLRK